MDFLLAGGVVFYFGDSANDKTPSNQELGGHQRLDVFAD